MGQIPEGHARLVALEWLIERLAMSYCLRQPDPMGAAQLIKGAGGDYAEELVELASNNPDNLQMLIATEIGEAISKLTDQIAGLVGAEL
jgi:hypothetical protein